MSKETPKFKGDARESREERPLEDREYSRVSRKHPDRNEDAMLGDTARISREMKKMPRFGDDESVLVADAGMDAMFAAHESAVRAAGEKESEASGKLQELGIRGVFDGVGGEGGRGTGSGFVASRIASGEVASRLAQLEASAGVDATKDAIKDALVTAHARILEHKKAHEGVLDDNGKGSLRNMGATVDVMREIPDKDGEGAEIVWGHSGDGRIYHLDGETGEVTQITKDDNGLDQMVEQKFLTKKQADIVRDNYRKGDEAVRKLLPDLPDHVFKFAMKAPQSLAASLGADRMTPAVGSFRVKKGDRVLVSTDGIHDNLSDAQIAELMRGGAGAKELADAAYANAGGDSGERKAGAKGPDDITLNVVEVGERRAESAKAEAPAESMADLRAGVTMAQKAVENAANDRERYAALMDLSEMLHDAMNGAAGEASKDLKVIAGIREELRNATVQMRELRAAMDRDQQTKDAAGLEAARGAIETIDDADLIEVDDEGDEVINADEITEIDEDGTEILSDEDLEEVSPESGARTIGTPPPKPKKKGFLSRLFGKKDDAA